MKDENMDGHWHARGRPPAAHVYRWVKGAMVKTPLGMMPSVSRESHANSSWSAADAQREADRRNAAGDAA